MDKTKRQLLKGLALAPVLATPALLLNSTKPTFAAGIPASHTTQVPGIYRFWVGEFEVTALLDGYSTMPTDFISGFDPKIAEETNRRTYKPYDPNQISIPVNGYVVNTGKNLILLDAGAPGFAAPGLGHLSENLAAAGFQPDDIDTLLFTHLHVDHVGALLDTNGQKAFVNANFVCSETEWDFTHDDAIYAASPEAFRSFIDLSRQMVAPYAAHRQMFSGEGEILPGITAIPLPGHTPGHTGFALESGGESLLIWGDVIHFSGLQFANPNWGVVFDADIAQAQETRAAMLDRASADQMAVAGMHIDFPGIGYVERMNDTYRYISAPWRSGS